MQPRVIPGVLVNGIKLGQRERGSGELELKTQAGGSAEMDGGRGWENSGHSDRNQVWTP